MSLMYNPYKEDYLSLADLATLPVPAPRGPNHHPYSFYDYANTVAEALPKAGLVANDAEFAVSKDGDRMFGVIELRQSNPDLAFQIGLRGSHDMRVSRGLVAGERVMVCSNLCFSGAIDIRTKQTTFIEDRIEGMVLEAVEQMPGYFAMEETMIERLKDQRVKQSAADAALVEIFRRGGLSGAQLAHAVNEWDTPSFDHGEHDSVWHVEQCATQALKPTGSTVNMDLVAQRSRIVRHTLTDLFNLAA